MGLMDIRRRILADAPQLATASGAVASFQTDMAAPIKKCEFAIEPVQSGTGDPSPSNVRPISGWTGVNGYHAKKNLLPASIPSNIITADFNNSAIFAATYARTFAIPVPPNTDIYVQKKSGNTNGHNIALGDTGNIAVGTPVYETSGFSNLTGKQYNTGNHTWLYIKSSSQTYAEELFTTTEFMVSVGTTRQEYVAPYTAEQIAVEFPAVGKNLIDPSKKAKASTQMAKWYNDGTGFLLRGGQAYTLSNNLDLGTVYIYNINGTNLANSPYKLTYTPSADVYVYFQVYLSASDASRLDDLQMQLELGSTATAYEPYGTIYGGTLDVTTGVLTVTHGITNLTAGGKQGTWDAQTGKGAYWYTSGIQTLESTNDGVLCNRLTLRNSVTYENTTSIIVWYTNSIIRWIEVDKMGLSKEDYNAYLAENPLQVTYKLATPRTYQLTPQQITTLKGMNNVWNTCGDTSVTYWKH